MKKIEEFDNYGLDLSRSAQHKTHIGGCYSILMVLVTIGVIGFSFISYFTQTDSVIMNYVFSFREYPISPVNYNNLNINGSLFFATKPESISDLMKYFKIIFEYQTDVSGKTELIIVKCKEEEKRCSFDIPFKNEYFSHHFMNLSPSFGIESCKKLKTILGPAHPLLADCAPDFDSIYEKEYIKNNFLFLDYRLPHFEITLNGQFNQTFQSERVGFFITKGTVHHYISELNLINVLYANRLLSAEVHNDTYVNWISPRLTDPPKADDYNLRIIFSFRFIDDVIYYRLEKTSFFMTLVNLGGLLKLLSLIYLVPNIWNEYYLQKALFQVKELYQKDEEKEKEKEEGEEEKKEDENNNENAQEPKVDIDWSKISFCKWYWLTCCCNCSAKKKLIKKKYKQLLEEYQCRSYIRPDNKSKWFDISKLMLQEDSEINEMLKDSTNPEPQKEDEIKVKQENTQQESKEEEE